MVPHYSAFVAFVSKNPMIHVADTFGLDLEEVAENGHAQVHLYYTQKVLEQGLVVAQDRLIRVDDKDVSTKPCSEVQFLLQGLEQDSVTCVFRPYDQTQELRRAHQSESSAVGNFQSPPGKGKPKKGKRSGKNISRKTKASSTNLVGREIEYDRNIADNGMYIYEVFGCNAVFKISFICNIQNVARCHRSFIYCLRSCTFPN